MPILRPFIYAGLAALTLAGSPALAAPSSYELVKTIPLSGPTHWDYLHYDAAANRVYISHGTELTVVDAASGAVIGHVRGLDGSHGIAIDHANGLGYADSSGNRTTSIFDLRSLKVVKTIPALLDADGMAFDKPSGQVFIAAGDSAAVLAVNTSTNEPGAKIDLGGAPEFLVTDDDGALYVAINDHNQIVKIDTATDKVTARWDLPGCDGPTGLAIDIKGHRLFTSCANGVMAVMNAQTGSLVATLSIGKGTDTAMFDPRRDLAFSSNRDGTLSIIKEITPDQFTVLKPVKTALGARTMTLDPATGRLFLVTAKVDGAGPPKHAGGPPMLKFAPGSFELLIFDPADHG